MLYSTHVSIKHMCVLNIILQFLCYTFIKFYHFIHMFLLSIYSRTHAPSIGSCNNPISEPLSSTGSSDNMIHLPLGTSKTLEGASGFIFVT